MSDMGDTPSPRSTTTPAGSQSPRAASSTAERPTSPKKAAQTKGEGKVTKRRAARACASCRARKVRCDVVEGAPCGNCRWDDVPCIVQESRRRKKNLSYNVNCGPAAVGGRAGSAEVLRSRSLSIAAPVSITANLAPSNGPFAVPVNGVNGDLYHNLAGGYGTAADAATAAPLSGLGPVTAGIPGALPEALLPLLRSVLEQATELPAFIKPIPDKISPEDRQYLLQKQVFSLPPLPLQNALLKAYVEYVHPYMPLLELHDFLSVVNDRTGASGKVSLFLYHAVMFAATAFVDESLLKDSGYDSRRDARRTFFSRTRLIYDFDYETDRLIAVQGLLLMTYWYETPDDQKDTWYWMGDAISLAHTIGLHRNPAETPMIPRKQKLWKRVWWSCFMRDRLVALGMRRPTRIKAEDFDVPPLTVDDFEIGALPEENQLLDPDCALMRNVEMQRELAVMCIEKAKLCTFIGDVLRSQYSVLGRAGVRPEQTTTSTHMLLPNKSIDNMDEVEKVDEHLRGWFEDLPECCQHQPLDSVSVAGAKGPLAVQRNLLHMIYHTTVSALHRPLFLPASPVQGPSNSLEVQETARQRVREAAQHITGMVAEMRRHGLERYLPTTGVTVILPAMIIHLLDTKSPDTETRAKAIQGLRECLIVMSNLRNIYAAADFATGFLDALLRKGMLGGLPSQPPPPPPILRAPAPGKTLHRTLAPAAISSNSSVLSPPQTALIPERRPTTPPPEKANARVPPVLHPAHVASGLYHASQLFVPGATTVRDADGDLVMGQAAAAAAADAATPPPTDGEDAVTPSGSGGDGVTGGLLLPSLLPMAGLADQNGGLEQYATAAAAVAAAMMGHGHGHGHGQGDGMAAAAAGNTFDFDQWLQFPAEGGPSTSDDTFMGGMFGGGGGGGEPLGGDAAIDWLGSMAEGLGH